MANFVAASCKHLRQHVVVGRRPIGEAVCRIVGEFWKGRFGKGGFGFWLVAVGDLRGDF
jgi:hypothetical protein